MQRPPFQRVEPANATLYAAGEAAPDWTPGDFLLTHGSAPFSRLIQFGQSLRIHGTDRTFTFWNHAALIINEDGDLIEALGGGLTRTNARKYQPNDYAIVPVRAEKADRLQVVRFAEYMADKHPPYGWLTIASIALTLLTGGKFTFFIDGQMICSGFVARALERTDAIFNREPVHIMPADLAKYYSVPGRG
jgi:hypothetical protein